MARRTSPGSPGTARSDRETSSAPSPETATRAPQEANIAPIVRNDVKRRISGTFTVTSGVERLPENRGVPGSSPGLAIPERPANPGTRWFRLRGDGQAGDRPSAFSGLFRWPSGGSTGGQRIGRPVMRSALMRTSVLGSSTTPRSPEIPGGGALWVDVFAAVRTGRRAVAHQSRRGQRPERVGPGRRGGSARQPMAARKTSIWRGHSHRLEAQPR